MTRDDLQGIYIKDTDAENRLDLAHALRFLYNHELDDPFAGHVTVRVPGTSRFLFSPMAVPWNAIVADDVISATEEDVRLRTAGPLNYPAATNNLGLLLRPEVGAVVHLHPPSSTVLGAIGSPISPFCQEACLFFESQVVIDDRFDFDPNRPEWLAQSMGTARVLIIRNHGIMVQSVDLGSAVAFSVQFEACARMQVALLSANAQYSLIPPEAARRFRDTNGSMPAALAWYQERLRSFLDA